MIFSIIASAYCNHPEFRYSAKKETCKTMSAIQVLFFDNYYIFSEVRLLIANMPSLYFFITL